MLVYPGDLPMPAMNRHECKELVREWQQRLTDETGQVLYDVFWQRTKGKGINLMNTADLIGLLCDEIAELRAKMRLDDPTEGGVPRGL